MIASLSCLSYIGKNTKGKGLSSNAVQKQKIIGALRKTGMSDEEISEAFKLYNIERKVSYKNGKKIREVVMLPKTMNKDEEINEVIHVSLPNRA